jgi:hypothetical protein
VQNGKMNELNENFRTQSEKFRFGCFWTSQLPSGGQDHNADENRYFHNLKV